MNLGCGLKPMPGWVNVDVVQADGVDVVHDLDVGPWPFKDGEVEQINADMVFEHVNNPVLFMTECHRVLKDGGLLRIRVPQGIDAFTDPTHKRFCTPYTFDYWVPDTAYHKELNVAYGGVSYGKVDLKVEGGALAVVLAKISA